MMRPAVGLMPTTELALDGHKMEPSVSVRRDTATKFAVTDIADPLLDPQGSADRTLLVIFFTCRTLIVVKLQQRRICRRR